MPNWSGAPMSYTRGYVPLTRLSVNSQSGRRGSDEMRLYSDEWWKVKQRYGELTPEELRAFPISGAKVLYLRLSIGHNVPMTYEAIGREFAVTRERIRQIERRAIRLMDIVGCRHE